MKPIKVAVIGLGNCASSLVQGVAYYRKNNSSGGLIHQNIGGYGAGDVDFVMGVDVDARKVGKDIDVYFDGAPTGSAGSERYGRVTAYFVSDRSTADAAIEQRLESLKRDARNWTVVSSDARVLSAARSARAKTETSEDFARKLRGATARKPQPGMAELGRSGGGLSEVELNHWLDLFKKR